MCQDMYDIVRSLQPSAVVLSPSGVGSPNGPADEVRAFFSNGGKGYADAVAFHGYPPCCSTPYPHEDILNILAPCLEPGDQCPRKPRCPKPWTGFSSGEGRLRSGWHDGIWRRPRWS